MQVSRFTGKRFSLLASSNRSTTVVCAPVVNSVMDAGRILGTRYDLNSLQTVGFLLRMLAERLVCN